MALLDHLRETFEKFTHELRDDAHDARTEVMDAVRSGLAEVSHEVDAFVADAQAWGLAHPLTVFALLRKLQPILVRKSFALVTRFDDVQDVLARDDVFDVTYAEKMKLVTDGENFFLGMRNTPRYTRDQANMRIAVRREDLDQLVGPLVERTARAIVDQAHGSLEIVTALTRVVPARLCGGYFGTPGPSEGEMIAWTSVLFQFLFFDPNNDPELRARAVRASAALNAYIDATIVERKAKPRAGDDILSRCLALQRASVPGMRDLDIRNDFIGLLIGAIPTTATATALVVNELLDRPTELEAARTAAVAGDDTLLAKYVFEAMRFSPMNPGIFRVANQEYVLGRGTARATTIAPGTTVLAATQSAMFDAKRIEDPDSFRVDRPSYAYLHFGFGLHTCFGQYLNAVQIPKIVKSLLLRENLRRAPGSAGALQKDGPYAGSLTVAFD